MMTDQNIISGYHIRSIRIDGFTVMELNGPRGRFFVCDCGEESCKHIRQTKSFNYRLKQRLAQVVSYIFRFTQPTIKE